MRLDVGPSARARVHERAVDAALLDQRLQHARKPRDVAADVHLHEVVHELRAEERARGHARDPVALEPRLADGVHDDDARAAFLRDAHVLRRDGLVVREIRANEDEEVGADEV